VNHPHVESSKSIRSRHLGVVDQENVEKVMKIQDLSKFINKLETVKMFFINLDLLIVWRFIIFFFIFYELLKKNRTIRALYFLRLLA